VTETLRERARNKANLNPHKPARLAMAWFGYEYSQQGGGSMDFWEKLSAPRKKLMREVVANILKSRDE